jgi:hypothetical protein
VKKQKSNPNTFELEMFSSPQQINNVQVEIKHYLDQETVGQDVDVLNYWLGQRKKFLILSRMAQCFLATVGC